MYVGELTGLNTAGRIGVAGGGVTIILCGIIGMILGSLRGKAEKWIEHRVRRMFSKTDRPVPAAVSQSPLPSAPDPPHCPSCNTPMVPRQDKRGARAGEHFWGCTAYPACRGTRPMQTSG